MGPQAQVGLQPFAGGASALPGSTAGWERPDSAVSSAARRLSWYHGILLKANHPESSREPFSPQARSRRHRRALLLGCLLSPASSKLFQTRPRVGCRWEDWGSLSSLWPRSPCANADIETATLIPSQTHFTLILQQDGDAAVRPRCQALFSGAQ